MATPTTKYYNVFYTRKYNPRAKKQKGFQDGILIHKPVPSYSILFDMEGKKTSESRIKFLEYDEDEDITTTRMNSIYIEIDQEISETDYNSGKCFLDQAKTVITIPKVKPIFKPKPAKLDPSKLKAEDLPNCFIINKDSKNQN